ncbi:MAG: adenosine kinase [Planctomycetota bacterium]
MSKLDVYGVGNALVDILAKVDDDFLAAHELTKGAMMLVDATRQAGLLNHLEQHQLSMRSGGSAANTMVALAQSGGTGTYAGKVAKDTNGEFYRQDMAESGIGFDVEMAPVAGLPTGTSLILTTPDAERTMCTNLGVSTTLTAADIDVDRMKTCKYSYIEGYLWDAEGPRAACVEAMEQSNKIGIKTSFTFSDSFLVDRFPDDFRRVAREYCDLVFCNADEAKQLWESDSLEECAKKFAEVVEMAFITDGSTGCVVVHEGNVATVEGFKADAVDTNGAGDSFAGGVLYGLTQGKSPLEAAKWGNYFASRIVQQFGPRLSESLANKVPEILV